MPYLRLLTAALLASAPLRAQVSTTPVPASPTEASMPSIALPPELERVLRDYERAWRAGDVRALAELFTPDGFVLASGRPPVRGRAAVSRAYEGQSGPLTLRALAFATGDSVGYIIGAYTYAPAAGDQGKFTLTLRRAPDRRWLIASDMDNSIRPSRAAPSP